MRRAGALGVLGAGVGASLVVRLANPLPPGDPLATTLAALPALIGAFFALGHFAEERGARRLPSALRRGIGVGLGLWSLLVLARVHLDLPFSAPALAAAGALLLAVYLPARLLALRPLLGRRLPDRPSWVFFALPLLAYLALAPWSTGQRPPDGDEPWYLLIAHSLAHDFNAELTDDYAEQDWRFFIDRPLEPQPGDPVGPGGELYSRHNALLPLLLAPAYRLAGKAGALAVMALLTAALAWFTLRLGRHYFPERPGEALIAFGLAAFAPPLLLYSHQIWVEVPAALVAMVALDAIRSARTRGKEGGSGEEGEGGARGNLAFWLSLGTLLLALPLLKIRFMLLAVPLLGLAWWHLGRPWRPMLILGAGLGAAGGGILLFNQIVYDNPLKIHSWQEVELHHYSLAQYLEGLVGLFWDTAFGLFAVAPLWLLLIPALAWLARRRTGLLLDLGVLVAPYLAVVAPRPEWYGGWSPPFRYALVALPLLALALVPLLARRRGPGARILVGALALFTLAFALLWVAVPGWTYNFADGRTDWLDYLNQRLGGDVARLFPSTVRPRLATWVWPLATLVLIPLFWWWPARWPGWHPSRWLGGPAPEAGAGPGTGYSAGHSAGHGAGRGGPWGAAAAVLLVAAVPGLARILPTRTIELEDPQVNTDGGHPQPDRWVIERTRYRGAWVLREGESATAPVVAGGEGLTLALEAYFARHHPGPLALELSAGGRPLATLELTTAEAWERYQLGDLPWPEGANSLTVRVVPTGHPGRPNGVALDRLELRWR